MGKFVIGDIHGAYRALLQCFERSGFNKDRDQLISIGDVADGWPEVPQCVEELLTIKKFINLRGNHDQWCYTWMMTEEGLAEWLDQGGEATKKGYDQLKGQIDFEKHIRFFGTQWNYYTDEENRAFVHAGYTSLEGLGHEESFNYWWDRTLYRKMLSAVPQWKKNGILPKLLRPYKEVFIGHTSTTNQGTDKPMNICGSLWNLDTGAGWDGKLTIMNVETKEFWQSDVVETLYDEKGRS